MNDWNPLCRKMVEAQSYAHLCLKKATQDKISLQTYEKDQTGIEMEASIHREFQKLDLQEVTLLMESMVVYFDQLLRMTGSSLGEFGIGVDLRKTQIDPEEPA